jgi:hypothetical protein
VFETIGTEGIGLKTGIIFCYICSILTGCWINKEDLTEERGIIVFVESKECLDILDLG